MAGFHARQTQARIARRTGGNMRSDLIDIEVTLHHQTEKAWLVESETSSPAKVWVPKSWGEISDEKPAPSKQATLTMSRSRFEEKGLV